MLNVEFTNIAAMHQWVRQIIHKPIHSSWTIAVTSIGIVLGVWLAKEIPVGVFSSIGWLFTGTGLVLLALWRRVTVWIIAAILGGFVIGLWRGSYVAADLHAYDRLIGRVVIIRGTVAEDVDTNKRGQLVLRLTNATTNSALLSGTIWVTTDSKNQKIQRSDVITISARLDKGFGNFAATAYSATIKKVEAPDMPDVALAIRNWFGDAARLAIPEPQSSLGLGYLVGQRRGLPAELDTALQAAGLTHIVVASGYNLTILVRLARRAFEKVSKYLSLLAALGMVGSFIAITGLSPSMSRAGLIATLSLFAWYYGRRFHPLVLLPFAMAITVVWQPSYVWGDLGWQLSFAAFAGVMVLAPLLNAFFFGDKKENTLRQIFIETIAAQIFTLPILLQAFGQFSVIAPIANMIILPFVPLAMLLTFIAGIGGLAAPSIAEYIGLPARGLLEYMTSTITFMGNMPWAVQPLQIVPTVTVAVYGCIIFGCWYMWRKTKLSLGSTSLVE